MLLTHRQTLEYYDRVPDAIEVLTGTGDPQARAHRQLVRNLAYKTRR
jgi:hypothetical protein